MQRLVQLAARVFCDPRKLRIEQSVHRNISIVAHNTYNKRLHDFAGLIVRIHSSSRSFNAVGCIFYS